ncbi:hypothetical protein ZHAS_00013719 [Anopheles sinensis]|uniref:Uncharacterized protein n=1 Tax=Anopheles sinensis TaxID=74873 RepID=A0A084W677_ANOSI|nr:hypothetical protein ZHAS_00013719 [Anopheles sinensis]
MTKLGTTRTDLFPGYLFNYESHRWVALAYACDQVEAHCPFHRSSNMCDGVFAQALGGRSFSAQSGGELNDYDKMCSVCCYKWYSSRLKSGANTSGRYGWCTNKLQSHSDEVSSSLVRRYDRKLPAWS